MRIYNVLFLNVWVCVVYYYIILISLFCIEGVWGGNNGQNRTFLQGDRVYCAWSVNNSQPFAGAVVKYPLRIITFSLNLCFAKNFLHTLPLKTTLHLYFLQMLVFWAHFVFVIRTKLVSCCLSLHPVALYQL